MPLSGVEELCQPPHSMLEAMDTTYLDVLVFVPKSEQEKMKLGFGRLAVCGICIGDRRRDSPPR